MVEMELNKIIIDENRRDQVIVLKEKGGERILPIVIGIAEAYAIDMKLKGINPARPLTHDLLKDVIDSLGAKLDRVIIDKLQDNTFHAKLILVLNGQEEKNIDARPSDSIALATRAQAPLFVEEDVLVKAEPFNSKGQ